MNNEVLYNFITKKNNNINKIYFSNDNNINDSNNNINDLNNEIINDNIINSNEEINFLNNNINISKNDINYDIKNISNNNYNNSLNNSNINNDNIIRANDKINTIQEENFLNNNIKTSEREINLGNKRKAKIIKKLVNKDVSLIKVNAKKEKNDDNQNIKKKNKQTFCEKFYDRCSIY